MLKRYLGSAIKVILIFSIYIPPHLINTLKIISSLQIKTRVIFTDR